MPKFEILKTYSEEEIAKLQAEFEKQPAIVQSYLLKRLHRIGIELRDSNMLCTSTKKYANSRSQFNTLLNLTGEDVLKIGHAMGIIQIIWLQENHKYITIKEILDEASFLDELIEAMEIDVAKVRERRNIAQKKYNKKKRQKVNDYARNYQAKRRAKLKAEKEAQNDSRNEATADTTESSTGTSGTLA